VFLLATTTIVAVSGLWPDNQPAILVLLALSGMFVLVIHDLLPADALGTAKFGVEGSVAITVATMLVALTGGVGSPFFFTYPLIVGGAALVAFDPATGPDLGPRLAATAEKLLDPWAERAERVSRQGYQRVVYLGSGALKALARESALKVLELTAGAMVAIGDSPLAFRHGPKAVLDDRTLVVVYLSNDPYTRGYDLDLLAELRRTQGTEHVLAVTAEHADLPADESTWTVPDATDLDDAALAIPAVLGAQLIALHASMTLGLQADNPFPSGDVNRVVQGVRIHPLVPAG